MANAFELFRQDKAFYAHDPVKEQIEYYKKQPLAYEVPEHIARFTERKKLVLQTPYFKIPTWASMPTFSGPHLEVVKDGVVVTRWPLHRAPYTLIGKNATVCDFVMEHPTTSGVHCAVVFHGEKREFYLIDLSSNGTALNGVRLPKAQPTLLPFGSAVTIALSTRTLVLRKDLSDAQRQRIVEGKNNNLTVPNPIPQTQTDIATTGDSHSSGDVVAMPSAALTIALATSTVATEGTRASPPATVQAPTPTPQLEIVLKRHFRHLLIKHLDVADPVSKASRNKGEAITRSSSDALELAGSLRSVLVAASSSASSVEEKAFVEFCQQYSECKTSKKGGDLGIIAKGDMDVEFDAPAFRLAPGAISAPVTTGLGVHLIYRCAE